MLYEPLVRLEFAQPVNVPVGELLYMLAKDYVYIWNEEGFEFKILVPCGDTNDGVSSPRFAWSLSNIRPDGLLRGAALIHDWLYRWKGAVPLYWFREIDEPSWNAMRRVFTRAEADALFLHMAKEAGVGTLKRAIAYRALRWFGWRAWSRVDDEP